ncbi:MAG: LamB/YcsF family protein [Chitinophagaceae bacterium]|nr:LamB/YcsF family protein [Chitinophagaceae bacterium]MBK8608047.1 LamB/YcsF family protein [Chitinophagaceae bacterium]MBP6476242.1 LamB/YcsF family protein [Chitinophagaceae bacterium]MBP7107997.1 LamB/YcsF family protein [Chitinophagaceae bacterium]MBP7313787.1 LamB/YcsF family protein [Chitinophagaceae bacterium]
MRPDINCDLGEGIGNDALIIPFITSANIACGYHAGDIDTMHQTIAICLKHNVSIGAHPSFLDRENFGRTEINLPVDDLYELLTQQLIIFSEVADIFDKTINHVKPHGALYNMSAKDAFIANIIAKAVNDFDSNLILYGLSGSHSISEANRMGLKTASEVFADRTYQDDGSLTPRSKHDALIIDADKMIQQVSQMINDGTVTTVSGKSIPIKAETICIHGDGKHAVEFAKAIHKLLSV